MGDYNLNFGGDDIYETLGYCALVGNIFMDILYRNIVFHNKLRFDAESSEVIAFINNMKEYCVENFYKNFQNLKWKIICFNYSYRFMKSTGIFNTNPDQPLDGKYYEKYSINEIKELEKNYQHIHFTFTSKVREYILCNGLFNRFVGINWQTDPDYTRVSQNKNDYYYFVIELLSEHRHVTNECFFNGINISNIFAVADNYTSARINNTVIDINKIYFLFQDMNMLINKITKEKVTLLLYSQVESDTLAEIQEKERKRNIKKQKDREKEIEKERAIKQLSEAEWKKQQEIEKRIIDEKIRLWRDNLDKDDEEELQEENRRIQENESKRKRDKEERDRKFKEIQSKEMDDHRKKIEKEEQEHRARIQTIKKQNGQDDITLLAKEREKRKQERKEQERIKKERKEQEEQERIKKKKKRTRSRTRKN